VNILRTLTLCASVALAASVHAAVSVTTDKRIAGVNEVFYLVVRAEGSRIGDPILPQAEGLVINRTPVNSSQQTSVNFINGRVQQSHVREWVYEAWATATGSVEIPPVKVTIGGQDELSEPVTMQIQQQPAGNPRTQTQTPSAPGTPRSLMEQFFTPQRQPSRGTAIRGDVDPEKMLILESAVTKTSVYEGEAFALVITFGRVDDPSVILRGDQGTQLMLPSVSGVYEAEPTREERAEQRDQLPYQFTIFTRAMAATQPGVITIPPLDWTGRVTLPTALGPRTFSLQRSTQAHTVEVKPLPERPGNFSGAVGEFTIAALLEAGPVLQGTPKELRIVVAGEGNPDAISRPTLPEMRWCHLSEPKVEVAPLSGALEFEKRFTYALTPLEAGAQVIPEIPFSYFAPDSGTYDIARTNAISLEVTPAKDASQLVVVGGQTGAATMMQAGELDIEPPLGAPETLARTRASWPMNLTGFGLPPLLFAAAWTSVRRRRRFATDVGYAPLMRAQARSRERLNEALRSQEPAAALFKALTGFLGDKLNLPDAGMTSQDVREAMTRRGYAPELVEEYVSVLRSCERASYAGAALEPEAAAQLYTAAESALSHLERAGGAR